MKKLRNWTSTILVITSLVTLAWGIIWTTTDGGWLPWVAYFSSIALALFNLRGMMRELEAWRVRR